MSNVNNITRSNIRIENFNSFNEFLSAEYSFRRESNNKFSIRQFAKLLQLNDSTVSQILRGKRTFSVEMIRKIGLTIGLNENELQYFVNLKTNDTKQVILKEKFIFNFNDNEVKTISYKICNGLDEWLQASNKTNSENKTGTLSVQILYTPE